MEKKFCVLFDMDGVLLDTETQYDVIWKHLGEKHNVGIQNFEKKIKGNTMPTILSTYFHHLSDAEKQKLREEHDAFEKRMRFEEIRGAEKFVKQLKENGVKIGLVTSSDDKKLSEVYKQVDFRKIMDTIVSADRITIGKPDPMCFLLAAKDLGYEPKDCFVFEDSFAGLASGNAANMRVIGLSTTHTEDLLAERCECSIPDFENFSLSNLEAMYENN